MKEERKAVVFVVDDDVSVRESLDSLLRAAGWTVNAFPTAAAFLAQPKPNLPHCLVLDLEMPGLSGLELQQLMAADYPATPIIFITGHGDIPTTVRAMKAGAVEFLTKPIRNEELLASVEQAITKSERMFEQDADLRLAQRRYASLTPREKQVMDEVVKGLPNKQIAADLGITEGTVKLHRAQVMQKMKVRSFADLVKIGQKLGP